MYFWISVFMIVLYIAWKMYIRKYLEKRRLKEEYKQLVNIAKRKETELMELAIENEYTKFINK